MKAKQPQANALRAWTVSVGISLGTVILCGIAPGTTTGCLSNNSSTPCSPITVPEVSPIHQRVVDKIDILLDIDNSPGMADKQEILAQTIPDLVLGLINPRCVDNMGVPAAKQPIGPFDLCPLGASREFDPIVDIHIGMVTSSLGGHGADSCPDTETGPADCGTTPNLTNNDKGHLVTRQDQCGNTNVPSYLDQGFLAWDPMGQLNPPGESISGDLQGTTGLIPHLRDMVKGVGQIGCGFESQLESWYRFLVDPEPFQSISVINGSATPSPEIDLALISQRAEFLRPDSLVAIIMLTDVVPVPGMLPVAVPHVLWSVEDISATPTPAVH